MIRILSGLRVNESHIQENLMKFKDPMMSESVMIALVSKGMARQEAHRLLQQLVFKSQDEKKSFSEILFSNPTISKYLTTQEVNAALEPKAYIGMSHELVGDAVQKTVAERRARGLQD
jgi:adenylosuccinate lyase